MNNNNDLKKCADTYYFRVSRAVLVLTAILSVAVLKIVAVTRADPELAVRFDPLVPEMMKNLLLICSFVLGGALFFEVFVNCGD